MESEKNDDDKQVGTESEINADKEVTLESVKELMMERDEIDRRIAKEEEILRINNIDMQQSLVDAENYPIASIDVYSVRQARHAIICAQNDRQKLTSQIEKAMLILHQRKRNCISSCSEQSTKEENNQSAPATKNIPEVHRTSNAPFAKIAKVLDASPAFQAGLKDGDQLIQFGSLHAGNFIDLKQIRAIVENSIGKLIRVTVLRNDRPIRLELVPQKWSGKGVLGCAVLSITPAHI